MRQSQRGDYGFDAPTTVRNFILIGVGLIALGVVLVERSLFSSPISFLNSELFYWPGGSFFITGVWMILGSRVLKFRARDKLINSLALNGTENTLDVGCGRGLLLIKTAKALTTGIATGVDVWQTVDQSGNDPKVTLQNAKREGVEEKIRIVTGDARKLPFNDSTFDVLTSSWAIHNISSRAEREQALTEMLRVLKPGGRLALLDIQYFYQYKQFFKSRVDIIFQMNGPDFTFLTPTYFFLVQKKQDASLGFQI